MDKRAAGSLLALVFVFVGFCPAAQGEWDPTWGAELTFTSPPQEASTDHGPKGTRPWSEENQEALESFYETVTGLVEDRTDVRLEYLEEEDKWGNDVVRVKYSDGWHFDVTMDPACLEVVLPPFVKSDLQRMVPRLEKDLYPWMKAIGLKPKRSSGGGHIHMGAESAFGDDVKLFRNFLVDQANHTELATGGMENDSDNAASYVTLNDNQRRAFAEIIAEADAGKFKTVRKLATDFVARVFFEGKPATGKRIMQAKYFQMNLLRMAYLDTWDTLEPNERWDDYEAWILFDEVEKKARTAEWRAIRTQESPEDLETDVELLYGRMKYLRGLTQPLKLSEDFLKGKKPNAKKGAAQLYEFISESGMAPARYASRLPKQGNLPKEFRKLLASCSAGLAALGN